VGTYTFQTHFPEQQVTVTYFDINTGLLFPAGSTFLASDSDVISLTVNEDPIQYYPDIPLPTEFWSRPVDSQLRGWSGIAGNWLEPPGPFSSSYAPYNDGPETAHILWANPLTTGGLVGGITGEHSMEDGDAYEGKWPSPLIINGILYYNEYGSGFSGTFGSVDRVNAVDLRTGEKLWEKEGIKFSFGQTFYFSSFNYHGVFDYLWEVQSSFFGPATWNAYDPFTSDWEWSITDVPSGIRYTGPNGEFYILVTDFTNGWMALWNQTLVPFLEPGAINMQGSWGSHVYNKVINGSMAYSWNATIPTDLPPYTESPIFPLGPKLIDDRVVGIQLSPTRDNVKMWAISLKEGQEGQVIFNTEWTPPTEWQTGLSTIFYRGNTDYGEGGVFILANKEERNFYGFSTDTGAYLWTTEPEHYLQALGGFDLLVVDDKCYSMSVAGILYCYDVHTGETLWTYESTDPYSEYLFGNNWWGWVTFIADGKVYIVHVEHSSLDPKPRGAPFVCLDAETGELIWNAEGLFRATLWGGRPIIGDSIIATFDTYDNRIYAIGKGPSQTTVTAPDAGIALGASVMIRGFVTDISAGTADPAITARFPNGVAAIADESMSDWMTYVYKQFPRPTDAVGVDVIIDVVDSNGNYRNIGTTTSDVSGFFSYQWTPDIPGKYTVFATFAGSEAYYASYSETAFGVDEAPEPTAAPTATPAPQTDTYIAGSTVAILAGLAVAVFLILRKKG